MTPDFAPRKERCSTRSAKWPDPRVPAQASAGRNICSTTTFAFAGRVLLSTFMGFNTIGPASPRLRVVAQESDAVPPRHGFIQQSTSQTINSVASVVSATRLKHGALRTLQFTLDLIFSSAICLIPTLVVLLVPRNPDGTLGHLFVAVPLIGLGFLAAVGLSWAYWSVLAAYLGGRTLAMRWLGLQVLESDGHPARMGSLSLRWVGLAVDGAFFGLVGLGFILATPRGQRFGDLLARTTVISSEEAPKRTASR